MSNLIPKTAKYANQMLYTDIRPYEIVRVISDKTIDIRRMKATPDPTWKAEFVRGGFAGHCINSDDQRWIIESDPEQPVIRARLRKDGYFWSKEGRHRLAEQPKYFYDHNF